MSLFFFRTVVFLPRRHRFEHDGGGRKQSDLLEFGRIEVGVDRDRSHRCGRLLLLLLLRFGRRRLCFRCLLCLFVLSLGLENRASVLHVHVRERQRSFHHGRIETFGDQFVHLRRA